MSKAKKAKFSERCRFCLECGDLQRLWDEGARDGAKPPYGELLADCFAINLRPTEHKDLMCKQCVSQLRNACRLKQLFLASDEVLSKGAPKKEETVSDDEYTEQSTSIVEDDDPGDEYQELEFLEEDSYDEVKTEPQAKRKRRKREKSKSKAYTKVEMRKAMDAVQTRLMSRSEAASYFHVPYKTLAGKLRSEAIKLQYPDSPNEIDITKAKSREEVLKLVKEIETLLTYTNATPFKTKASKYLCAYCTTDGPLFEDPDELRSHVRTRHINDRVNGVQMFMRPHCLNEVAKVDIVDLLCTVCCLSLEGWNEMFEHLSEKHEVVFDQATAKVIPFKLNEELACVFCNKGCPSFCVLDCHMNGHYNNHVCGECGSTFLTESRLRSHEGSHRVGKFPCHVCSKVFPREKYRRQHIDVVHKSPVNFKCRHCPKKFKLELDRAQHEATNPRCAKMKDITCSVCEKEFSCRQVYLTHVRLRHSDEKKYQCSVCGKQFKLLYELKNHMNWHNGTHYCQICGKKFAAKQNLMNHMTSHVGEIISARNKKA